MPQRKRKPGAGRPKKPDLERLIPLSTRVRADVRERLLREAAAAKPPVSLAEYASDCITKAVGLTVAMERLLGPPHCRAAVEAIADAMRRIEATTGHAWNQDRFTYEAVRECVLQLLDALVLGRLPTGQAKTPDRIIKDIERVAPGLRSAYEPLRSSGGVAAMTAVSILDAIATAPPQPRNVPEGERFAAEYYRYPRWRAALGLEKKEKKS